jgi:hypothetical protein
VRFEMTVSALTVDATEIQVTPSLECCQSYELRVFAART